MKIRLLTRAAGPQWNEGAGAVLDVPETQAALLIQGGYAVAVEKRRLAPEAAPIEPQAEAVETAEAPAAPEKAIRRPRRK